MEDPASVAPCLPLAGFDITCLGPYGSNQKTETFESPEIVSSGPFSFFGGLLTLATSSKVFYGFLTELLPPGHLYQVLILSMRVANLLRISQMPLKR